jgi:hypothetical protein
MGVTSLVFCALAAAPSFLLAQTGDTIVLTVGSPRVDGRWYRPHLAGASLTLSRGGVDQTTWFSLDLSRGEHRGIPVYRIQVESSPAANNTGSFVETDLDYRTLAPVYREERNGAGRLLIADIAGSHAYGSERAGWDSATVPLEVMLDVPAYHFGFVDAVIASTHRLQLGQVFRVPTMALDPGSRRTEWHTYEVVSRDSVNVHGRQVPAWIIEERWDGRYRDRRIWLIDEPPYLPRIVTTYPDGSVRRFESWLVRLHA